MNRHIMIGTVAGALLWLSAGEALAVDCRNPGPQIEINYCAGEAYKRADKKLNRVWRAIPKSTRRGNLLKAQRIWIKYRDLECLAEGDPYQGGSIQSSIISSCKTRMTKTRTKELREFLPR
ncbi:MAG: DUF1311 domain-containing protein [Magnetococcales bacterium]|nr:DUF1311 domain-containing protein [Magnetococcales bacterium]